MSCGIGLTQSHATVYTADHFVLQLSKLLINYGLRKKLSLGPAGSRDNLTVRAVIFPSYDAQLLFRVVLPVNTGTYILLHK